jgi:hypothetical protein
MGPPWSGAKNKRFYQGAIIGICGRRKPERRRLTFLASIGGINLLLVEDLEVSEAQRLKSLEGKRGSWLKATLANAMVKQYIAAKTVWSAPVRGSR